LKDCLRWHAKRIFPPLVIATTACVAIMLGMAPSRFRFDRLSSKILIPKAVAAAASPAASSSSTAASNSSPAAAKKDTKTNAPTSTAVGGNTAAAQVVSLKTEQQQLRRMGEAIKRTSRCATDLIGECTQPIEMMEKLILSGQERYSNNATNIRRVRQPLHATTPQIYQSAHGTVDSTNANSDRNVDPY